MFLPEELLAPYGPLWLNDNDQWEWDDRYGECPDDLELFVDMEADQYARQLQDTY